MRGRFALNDVHCLQRVGLLVIGLAGASVAGCRIAAGSTTPLIAVLAVGFLVAMARSPRVWLVLVIVLTANMSYDNVFAGGFLSWSKLLTMAMLAIYGARAALGRARIDVSDDWSLPLVLILGWSATSVSWAFAPERALMVLASWISLFVLQVLIFNVFREDFRGVEMALYAHIGTMTIIALIGLYASVFGSGSGFAGTMVEGSMRYGGPFGTAGRFFGFYPDPNSVAMLFNYAIFVLVAMLSGRESSAGWSLSRTVLLALTGVLMTAMMLTYSRSGLAGFLVGMGYLAYRSRKHAHVLGSLALGGGVLYLFRSGIAARLAGLSSRGAEGRLPELKLGLKQFLAHPILGIGLESFMPRNRALGVQVLPGVNPVIHNTYLKFLTELGVPGFLLLVWFCIALAKRHRRNSRLVREIRSSKLRWANVGFGACFLGTGVFALAQGVTGYNPFWIFLGLFAATSAEIERAFGERQ